MEIEWEIDWEKLHALEDAVRLAIEERGGTAPAVINGLHLTWVPPDDLKRAFEILNSCWRDRE